MPLFRRRLNNIRVPPEHPSLSPAADKGRIGRETAKAQRKLAIAQVSVRQIHGLVETHHGESGESLARALVGDPERKRADAICGVEDHAMRFHAGEFGNRGTPEFLLLVMWWAEGWVVGDDEDASFFAPLLFEDFHPAVSQPEHVPVVAVWRGYGVSLGFLDHATTAGEFGQLGFDRYVEVDVVFEDECAADLVANNPGPYMLVSWSENVGIVRCAYVCSAFM